MAKKTRIAIFFICDLLCFNASYLFAFLINAASSPEGISQAGAMGIFSAAYPAGFLILIIIKLVAMYVSSAYKIMFEYSDIRDFRRTALSLVACTLASVTAAALIGIGAALLPPVILLSFLFDIALVLTVRGLYIRQTAGNRNREKEGSEGEVLRRRYNPQKAPAGRVMIIGANRAAVDLITEMQANKSSGRTPEVIIDDDKSHDGDMMLGVEIVARRSEISLRARRQSIDEIIIAKPDVSKRQLATLLRESVKTRCRISMLPLARSSEKLPADRPASLADLRKPVITDLLGRERPRVDHRKIGDELKGRIVLVTGGAGVFGSELCRSIIRYKPRRLIALDTDEDGLALLMTELEEYRSAETEFRTVVATVRDATIMRRVFSAFRPHLVFHAAELKQIPLAQANPRETFLTNVIGLKTAADLADEYSAEKFILCSTTRAAVPTNVASQCKRTAELYIAEKNEKAHTKFTSVRFPNLIEGRGNVLAVFKKQLEQGVPLTLTDENAVRRFIGAEEASMLMVLAAAQAAGGEVFEVGPGEPIRIRELAEAMIRLEGKIPYEEIGVVVTQIRAGERLFDEAGERTPRDTAQGTERIWVAEERGAGKLPHWSLLWRQEPERMDDAAVIETLRLIFPTYKTKAAGATTRGVKVDNE